MPTLRPPLRLICLLILGFSSGLPLALTASTLQAWMSVENIDIKTIGLYSIVGFPYTYKFLWSPLLDYLKPGFFDRRRGWIVLMQLGCAAGLALMPLIGVHSALALAGAAVLVAFFSATQDMCIDAYRTELLPAEERGLGAAWYVGGYRSAMLVSGGLALVMASTWLGFAGTYWLMAGLMVACSVATAFSPKLADEGHSEVGPTLMKIISHSAKDFFSRQGAIGLLVLIIFYKVGDAFAGSLTTAFLLKGLQLSLAEVGTINKTVSLIATLIGAFYGGAVLKRIGLFKALLVFGILQAVSNLSFWVLAVTTPHLWSMAAAVFIENICGGMGTAAFVALLTALCNRQFSATQYALLSSLASVGRVYLAAPAGFIVAAAGWDQFFLLSTAAAIPGLILLIWMKNAVNRAQP